MDDNENSNRLRAVQAQLEELESIETMHHVSRWKDRTRAVLEKVVSPDEADKFFYYYCGRTNLDEWEQLGEYKREYGNYLIALRDDLANQPDAPADIGAMSYFQGVACENGHKVARRTPVNPAAGGKHCPLCGAKTHASCPTCNEPLPAGERPNDLRERRQASTEDTSWPLAVFCYNCGEPYPWTIVRSDAAENMIDQLDELYPAEREALKASIPDLMADTPNSDAAVLGWKKAFRKLTGSAQTVAMKVIIDITSEAMKSRLDL